MAQVLGRQPGVPVHGEMMAGIGVPHAVVVPSLQNLLGPVPSAPEISERKRVACG